MRGTKAVLFDMDGVLVDSEEFIRRSAVMMFAEKGQSVTAQDFIPYTGMGENRFLGGVAEKYGVTLDIDRDKARTYEIYGEITRGKLVALPGVSEVLSLCKTRGLLCAVATSADRVKMEINLRQIGIPDNAFDVKVYADMIKHKKPHPEVYLTAAGMLGVEPSACLVVEDAPSGLEAGHAAGMKCLALTTSFPADELSSADWIIGDLSDFRDEFLDN
jgi:HAD superfamily hydrolase (TIGR01509 family)